MVCRFRAVTGTSRRNFTMPQQFSGTDRGSIARCFVAWFEDRAEYVGFVLEDGCRLTKDNDVWMLCTPDVEPPLVVGSTADAIALVRSCPIWLLNQIN